ncbi:MAG TPA: hypothetical protein VFG73_11720 [Rhodanobacteraceae bacterium]|nr:hypothetical protein [Rhodanobacteraceae bacterium]
MIPQFYRSCRALSRSGVTRVFAAGLLMLGMGLASHANAQIVSSHPRLILDQSTLKDLQARARAGDPDWLRLKATCDSYIGGVVNYPDQPTYPNPPTLGSEYAGHGYRIAVMNEGLCYQVMKGIDPAKAAPYGDKVAEILNAMSMPSGSHYVAPCTDAGYPIRTYGVALGIGFDWAYDRLSAQLKTQVYTAGNKWIDSFENASCSAFEYVHPQSNYYAGYFHALSAVALGTWGDNPQAPALWTDWLTTQFGQRVQPYYANWLSGGGWPEGFGNYAPNAILDMSLPLREAQTAAGLDLVDKAGALYSFPTDSGGYVMHFTWPSRDYFDDRDTNRANGNAETPPGTNNTGMFVHILGALRYWDDPRAGVFQTYLNDVDKATGGYGDDQPWARFLFAEPVANAPSLDVLPRSYVADGLGMVAARSDWSTSASWMSFRAGTYVNNPGQGEQYFDAGSLALVRGGTPLLLNATGWMVHEPGGTAAEDAIYTDNRGSFNPGNVYSGNRQIYNVFYVRNMSGGTLAEPFGQNGRTGEDGARTAVSKFEDGGDYVYTQGSHLEDMYRSFNAGPAVQSWSREIVYVRPNRFVVYDRTREGASSYDQYLAWHFPANPTTATAAAGENRLDVTFDGKFAGAATFVYPANNTVTTKPMYPTSSPTRAWQVQVRPADKNVEQRWLSVFDLAASSSQVGEALPVDVSAGNVIGTQVAGSGGGSVVLFNKGAPGTTLSGPIAYSIEAAQAKHIIVGLAPGSTYSVSTHASGGRQYVSLSAGGSLTASKEGVLSFTLDSAGTATASNDVIMQAGFDG